MKFQLHQHGWPIGDRLIPVGTVIEINAKGIGVDDWSRLAAGKAIPPNAVPLDQAAYEAMLAAGYQDWQISRVGDLVRRKG